MTLTAKYEGHDIFFVFDGKPKQYTMYAQNF